MPLITCPECESKISDLAQSCPKCGMPLSKKTTVSNTCPECNATVSGKDENCPKCGFPLLKKADESIKRQANDIASGWKIFKYLIYFAILFAVVTFVSDCIQNHQY